MSVAFFVISKKGKAPNKRCLACILILFDYTSVLRAVLYIVKFRNILIGIN